MNTLNNYDWFNDKSTLNLNSKYINKCINLAKIIKNQENLENLALHIYQKLKLKYPSN